MLKDVHQLLAPDPYYAGTAGFMGSSMEALYRDMSRLELPASVPEGVRQCHDAVRHAYIYSYFSYDLLTLAAAQTLPCLELALRERIGHQWEGKTNRKGDPIRPMLHTLLEEGARQGFIRYSTDGLHLLRNDFVHGSDAVLNPPMFLTVFELVTRIIAELFE